MSAQTPLAVFGATGRMGRAVVRLADAAGFRVVFAFAADQQGQDVGEVAGTPRLGVPITSELSGLALSGATVAIDFSHPSLLGAIVQASVAARVAFVSGTTGLAETDLSALQQAAEHIGVLWEPNMSIGVHVLSALVREATLALGPEYDIEVVETHHKHKMDAPSGTAIRLGDVAREARRALGEDLRFQHGREGKSAKREHGEIGMHALRGGDVIGDHSVHFLGNGERLELVHRASSRELFAQGALRAARYLVAAGPGLRKLADVVRVSREP